MLTRTAPEGFFSAPTGDLPAAPGFPPGPSTPPRVNVPCCRMFAGGLAVSDLPLVVPEERPERGYGGLLERKFCFEAMPENVEAGEEVEVEEEVAFEVTEIFGNVAYVEGIACESCPGGVSAGGGQLGGSGVG